MPDHGYCDAPKEDYTARTFYGSCGDDIKLWLLGTELNTVPAAAGADVDGGGLSKCLLWQDPLTGLLDAQIDGVGLSEYYGRLAQRLGDAANQSRTGSDIIRFAALLAQVLEDKSELGLRLTHAYLHKDHAQLAQLHDIVLPRLARNLSQLKKSHYELWMGAYKPFGWDVLDRRYGGLAARLDTCAGRIEQYLAGQIETIEELDEPRVLCFGSERGDLRDVYTNYQSIAGPSTII